ncbi:MAG: regulatory iron-sulfur-containing complex subunit RicT [Chloroflexi bacterium]|nr:regulatory iron-sulfur-containing complex subunit RicT [Chloroflexota bacterium]
MKIKEAEALVLARAKQRNLGLMMKITSARICLDARKVVFEFTASERIELRQLYGKLSDALNKKIELRSVGPRDEAKAIGGLGKCGRATCCSTWMTKFESVSIKMAKEQALPISAEGLAGQCGRLKRCLRFEYEQYRAGNKLLPRVGERVMTQDGPAKVIVGHPLKETVTVIPDRKSPDEFVRAIELPIADITRLPREDNQRRN